LVKVQIGKHQLEIPMFVGEIRLLKINFLKKINLENVFDSEFCNSKLLEAETSNCSRIKNLSEKVPSVLKESLY